MDNIFNVSNIEQLRRQWGAFAEKRKLDSRELSKNLQLRVEGTDPEHVETVKFQIENNQYEYPPVDVFELPTEGGATELVLVDGYHRVAALEALEEFQVDAKVYTGHTIKRARLFASLANAHHGKKSTEGDNTVAVEALLDMDGAKDRFISNYRLDLQGLHEYTGIPYSSLTRVTRELREGMEAERTQRILSLKEEGLSNRAVAVEVGVSEGTVRRIIKEDASSCEASETTQREPEARGMDGRSWREIGESLEGTVDPETGRVWVRRSTEDIQEDALNSISLLSATLWALGDSNKAVEGMASLVSREEWSLKDFILLSDNVQRILEAVAQIKGDSMPSPEELRKQIEKADKTAGEGRQRPTLTVVPNK